MVPKGMMHNPENGGDVPLRALTTISPAVFEGYFDKLAALAASLSPGPPPMDKMGEISERYGVVYMAPQ